MVVYMEAQPGKSDEVRKTYARLCPEFRTEPGCLEHQMYQSVERPDSFILLERWTDQESIDVHLKALNARGLDLEGMRRFVKADHYVEE
jgi:quinol monooxygenase YgiN